MSYRLIFIDSSNVNAETQHGATTTTSMDTINMEDPDMKLGRDGATFLLLLDTVLLCNFDPSRLPGVVLCFISRNGFRL